MPRSKTIPLCLAETLLALALEKRFRSRVVWVGQKANVYGENESRNGEFIVDFFGVIRTIDLARQRLCEISVKVRLERNEARQLQGRSVNVAIGRYIRGGFLDPIRHYRCDDTLQGLPSLHTTNSRFLQAG